jgi:hypothetical protein
MDRTKEEHQILCDSGKSATDTLAMIIQAFGKESITESSKSPKPKKARHLKSKLKSMLIILFDMKGIVYKEFVLAGQTVNFAYYCDVLCRLYENSPRTSETKELALHHDNAPPGNF